MGIYQVYCRQCERIFLWFSGNLDQRCHICRMYAQLPGPQRAAEGKPE